MWFVYSPDRKGEHPKVHLKNFKGALQDDAYAEFHHLYGGGDIYEVACWAHTRRKFHDIHAVHALPITTEAIARIGALYSIEEEVRGKPAELRCATRQARARPLLDELRGCLENLSARYPPRARLLARSAMRSRTGVRSPAMSMMGCWRSITRPPSARFVPSRWDGRTTSSVN